MWESALFFGEIGGIMNFNRIFLVTAVLIGLSFSSGQAAFLCGERQ
jgi:hypothetical protein